MAAVNLSTYSAQLTDAKRKVQSDSDPTNWLLCGYHGQTSDLKVVGTGDGGLEELAEEFDASKLLYAFARVIDPNHDVPKYVFISWTGEAVPSSRKGLSTQHVRDIERFFTGFHVQITARDEIDVTPTVILEQVRKSSGAKYSVHKEAPQKPDIPAKPVGSGYQKPQILAGNASQIRNQFEVTRVEEEEKARKQAEEENRRKKEAEQRRREAEERERADKARREAEEASRREAEARRAREAEQRKQREQEERRRREEEEASRQQAQLQAQAQAQAQSQAREREERARREADERSRRDAEERSRRDAEEKARREAADRSRRETEERSRRDAEERARREAEEAARLEAQRKDKQKAQPAPSEGLSARALFDYEAGEDNEISFAVGDIITNIDQIDEGWWQGFSSRDGRLGLFPSNYVELIQGNAPAPVVEDYEPPAPVATSSGVTAKALYDYDAAEDNEISFREGDLITNIEQIDPGWWQGTAPDGQIGLFPSNFVSLS